MNRHTIVLLCALSISSCTGGGTRPCPEFGSPLADEWSTGLNVGDVATFINETGATVSLELRSREDSEPYEGYSRFGRDEVGCSSESVRQFVFDNSDVSLQVRLSQLQYENATEDTSQPFSLRISPRPPAEELVVGYSFGFSLDLLARQNYSDSFVLDNDTESGPLAERFIENLQIGNNLYPYAVEQKFADLAPLMNAVTNVNSLGAISRMIVAEGAGLVQFELLNGEVYSRM